MSEFLVRELLDCITQTGRLEWIGLRPVTRAPMQVVESARAETGRGLIGECYAANPGARRQVTLLQAEHLAVVAALSGQARVPPEWLRRNLMVSVVRHPNPIPGPQVS